MGMGHGAVDALVALFQLLAVLPRHDGWHALGRLTRLRPLPGGVAVDVVDVEHPTMAVDACLPAYNESKASSAYMNKASSSTSSDIIEMNSSLI